MKTALWITLSCMMIGGFLFAQQRPPANIEFVESIPVETSLDNPDIRNTREVWLEMIRAARKTIDLEQFYISPQKGETLDDIIKALRTVAGQGVRVRFIIDKNMYKTYPAMADSFSRMKNISLRIIDFGLLAGGIQHAKYFVVDGEELFIGSQNFDWRSLSHIHELGLRVRQREIAKVYQQLFDLDWRLAALKEKDSLRLLLSSYSHSSPFPVRVSTSQYGTVTIQPTYSPRTVIPDTSLWDESHLMRLIGGAQKEVCLQFLSYSPRGRDNSYYEALDGSLRNAAARDVKVKLLVSDWQKGTRAERYLKELSAVPNIQVKFSAIPDWSRGYVSFARVEHCKYILVDGKRFWLGTSNGERSYFHTSRNAGLIVENDQLAARLHQIFYKSWESAYTELVHLSTTYAPRKHTEE
ncbi:MAG: phospholipase D-like domain-containing protein [bacterium]